MRRVVIDTETYLIGPGAVVPKLVCASFCDGKNAPRLLSTADAELEPLLDELFTPGNDTLLIFHNAAFDVPVIYRAFPKLQAKIWAKIAAEEITDTMLREQLLNLATHGKLDMFTAPDGSNKRLLYGLDALVDAYLGVDISASKSGDDAWRKNFSLLDGLKAAQYPAAAAEYAEGDALYTYDIAEEQENRAMEAADVDAALGNLECATFHTSAAIALAFITERGMATDEAEFNRLCTHLDQELSDENMKPLIRAGVMEPADPPLPYKQDEKKARELLASWLDRLPEDVDFRLIDEGLMQALTDAGVRVKAGTKSSIKTKQLKRYVVAALMAKQRNQDIEQILTTYKDTSHLDSLIANASAQGVVMEQTDTGDVSTASSVITTVADAHPVLKTYQHRQKLQKLVSTEIPRMMWDGKLAPVVHFPYKAILETGRTSSSATEKYPSANGQNVDPRARGVYVPRPGYVLCSCDYSALELVCVAQTTYSMFGKSVHRDKIMAGCDLHAYLGSRLAIEMASPEFVKLATEAGVLGNHDATYELFVSLGETSKLYKFWRKLAKPVGLGFPSGLGAATMVELAMKDPYNIDMLGLAEERFKSHPEEFDITRMAFHAKKLHGMSKDQLAWTPLLKAVAFAMRLRSIWLSVYPEMEQYFDAVKNMRDASGECYFMNQEKRKLFEEHMAEWLQLGGDESGEPAPDPEDYSGTSLLCYTTPLGMHRARCTYTAVSNGLSMQSPGAEGAKSAVILAVRAALDPASKSILANGGGYVVDFVHDELLVEVKDDELRHERAQAVRSLMEDGLRRVIVDVPVKASPVLMRRWSKDAARVVDAQGRLQVWEPKAVSA